MARDLQLRIASVLSFLYVAVFVGLQLYAAPKGGPTAPSGTLSDKQIDQYLEKLLPFIHQHLDYYTQTSLLVALSYLLLIGTAIGIYMVLRPYRATAALIVLCVSIVSIVVVAVATIIEVQVLSDFSGKIVRAATAAARLNVVHSFKDRSTTIQILNIVGSTGLALWLALIGVTFLRLQGMRSVNGWATLAAGLLSVVGFPALPIWALGAGIGLWRLSQAAYLLPFAATTATDAEIVDAEVVDTEETAPPRTRKSQVSTARRARQQALVTRGGSKGRKRR